jgi:hypothetical protein
MILPNTLLHKGTIVGPNVDAIVICCRAFGVRPFTIIWLYRPQF